MMRNLSAENIFTISHQSPAAMEQFQRNKWRNRRYYSRKTTPKVLYEIAEKFEFSSERDFQAKTSRKLLIFGRNHVISCLFNTGWRWMMMVANAPRETWARLKSADSLDKPYIGNYRRCGNVRTARIARRINVTQCDYSGPAASNYKPHKSDRNTRPSWMHIQ